LSSDPKLSLEQDAIVLKELREVISRDRCQSSVSATGEGERGKARLTVLDEALDDRVWHQLRVGNPIRDLFN
jgi:hypothetical protein